MDFNKMKHVLASRTRLSNEMRRSAAERKSQREATVRTYVQRKREQTQLRREQFAQKSSHHLGSKLALYSSAVTQANMAKSSSAMRRVNRHPHPNPTGGAARESQRPAVDDDADGASTADAAPTLRRVVPEPNIWGKIYAFEKAQADEKEREKAAKEQAAATEHTAYLATQVKAKARRKEALKAQEDKYAATEAAQRAKWREEEKQVAAAARDKAAREKKMFEDTLALTTKRRQAELQELQAEEMREVARIKRGQRAAEKRALREKRRQRAILEQFQVERKRDDEVQAKVRAARQLQEQEAAKDAERMMDKMDADRQNMLDAQHAHQAYLYGKAEGVQEKVAKELAEQERKMLAAFAKQNALEDARAREKERKRAQATREQKESIQAQLALQAKARREQAEFDFRMAHKAKVQDELEAFEMMQTHVKRRELDKKHHALLRQQRVEERARKKAEKATMTELEERLNATKIQQAEEWWKRKLAEDRLNPGEPLPACIGVADIGMK